MHESTVEQRHVLEALELAGIASAYRDREDRWYGVALDEATLWPVAICESRADVEALALKEGTTFKLYGVHARNESGKGASWSSHPSEVVRIETGVLPS